MAVATLDVTRVSFSASDGLFNNFIENELVDYGTQMSNKDFDIDPRRIRYWKKQKDELTRLADKSRARLAGGRRKKVSKLAWSYKQNCQSGSTPCRTNTTEYQEKWYKIKSWRSTIP